ncbi:MAG TPA: hypothetical protein VNU46_05640, partial [Gemmatimonadaceae bacterium]|nr:hypothetical protein [Gemmatimonadaceae bacterium]
AAYWAQVATSSSGATAAVANVAGSFASLWGSDTWYKTAGTLIGGEVASVLAAGAAMKTLDQQMMISQSWYRGTFADAEASAEWHLAKHGMGKTLDQYTQDALNFFQENESQAQSITLKDGTQGLRIRTPGGGPGGIFTPDGRIVTFWYH